MNVAVPSTPRLRSTVYPSALGAALLAVAHVQVRRWDRALRNVEAEQRAILRRLLRHSAGSELGRRWSFDRIRDYEQFARQVPIGDYDSFSPFIERMRRGTKNLLVPEFVRYFGNSSGSSDAGRSKFLPITERQIAEQRRSGADTLMRYLVWSGDRSLLSGFTLGLFHPTNMDVVGPVVITTNPVLMIRKMPALTKPVYLPDPTCDGMADYDAKMTAIAEKYMDHDVRALTGTTCWFPLLFERLIEVAQRRGRSARSVSEIWPNLRVLLGGGVSSTPYLPLIRRLMGRDDVTLVDSYNATEGGIYAASDHTGERGMLMLPHRGTFFEFVPLEEIDGPSPTRVPLWAVERDRSYAIVVTTSAGLFAYKLGDIVRFTSTTPLRIEFVGRLAGCLSVTQELATHVDIEHAVAHAVSKHPCTTVDFGASAEVGVDGTTKCRYVLFAEFGAGAAPADLRGFAAAFDEGLCKANRVYGEHRGVALLEARVVPLVAGGARAFLEEVTRGRLQGKFPRILDEGRTAQIAAYAQHG
jgi:hypothetical protein